MVEFQVLLAGESTLDNCIGVLSSSTDCLSDFSMTWALFYWSVFKDKHI